MFTMIALVLWWVLNLTPLYGVFATLGLAIVFMIAAQVLFSYRGLWIRESQPLVGVFLSYYLVVPYRLIREYKKRWDLQRKNELLLQVEELKTNFLSLVTHDLKTPVARIQGLAEVLIRKASERLLERDKDTLCNILNSTEELNRFISSILELNKVESNRLNINLESKDINQLIERSVEDFKAQARARKIKIITALEPLFPVKIDASLISKVINNLIDNALKYSPVESSIFIESKEVGDHIEVSVRDQGIGMTEEEQFSLFTRFYRAKNDTTTKVAGTGLGLYLTRYFVEAHNGSVAVQSELGKGSTFKIFLPIDNAASLSGPERGKKAMGPGLVRWLGGAFRKEKAVVKEKANV
jgi:signal transduction histidine kinase